MHVMIHAVPRRMWYVEGFLVPSLRAQGVEPEIWLDGKGRGNLGACLDSFRSLEGDGGTWHLQDDVLICSDFAQRAAVNDRGVVYGFCCVASGDDPRITGDVVPVFGWIGFPCVRIPDAHARAFADWVEAGGIGDRADKLIAANKGDDWLFHEFLRRERRGEKVRNLAPNLVEHVDWLIGGSVTNADRAEQPRSALWNEPEAVDRLAVAIEQYKR